MSMVLESARYCERYFYMFTASENHYNMTLYPRFFKSNHHDTDFVLL